MNYPYINIDFPGINLLCDMPFTYMYWLSDVHITGSSNIIEFEVPLFDFWWLKQEKILMLKMCSEKMNPFHFWKTSLPSPLVTVTIHSLDFESSIY